MQKKASPLLRGGVLAEAADVVADVLGPVGWMPEKMRIVRLCESSGLRVDSGRGGLAQAPPGRP